MLGRLSRYQYREDSLCTLKAAVSLCRLTHVATRHARAEIAPPIGRQTRPSPSPGAISSEYVADGDATSQQSLVSFPSVTAAMLHGTFSIFRY